MAETIKGINVVIGAETTGLSKALKDVNDKSRDIQSELRQVEKLLKFNPDNAELLAQKQKLLSDQIANTREKLDRLKVAQEQVNQQFQKGEISEAQYRAFQREIIKTESYLKKLTEIPSKIEEEFVSSFSKISKELELFSAKSKDINADLKEINTALQLDPNNIELAAKKQELLNEEINNTSNKLQILKSIQENVNKEFVDGKIGESEHRAFQREIIKTENELKKLTAVPPEIEEEFVSSFNKMGAELDRFSAKSKDIEADLKSINEAMELDPQNIELITKKQELLKEAISNTNDKLKLLKETQESVQKEFKDGSISESEYRAFQREIQNTENSLKSLENQLKNTGEKTDSFGDKVKKVSNELKSTGEDIKKIGEKMTVGITAPLMGIAAIATEGTKELREDMSKLDTNAQMAGASLDIVHNALRDLNAITGETDSNIEALSNLLEAGFKDNEMQKAVEALSGAVIKFPDTLKIESLADGLQETLATGEATGQFAELLERMGIDLETFNKGLERANKSGTEQQYILNTLAKTGLAEVNEAYRQNNKVLIENANAQHDLQQELAELGAILQPIVTDITRGIADLLKWFNGLDDGTKNLMITIAGIAAVLGPIITGFGQLMLGLGTITSLFSGTAAAAGTAATATAAAGTAAAGAGGAMGAFSGILAALTGPIGIAIAVIAALAAAAYLIVKNWEPIKEFFKDLWDSISAWTVEAWNNISQSLSNAWNSIKTAAISAWNTIVEEIKAILMPFFEMIIKNFEPMLEGLKAIFEGIKLYFSGIWEAIKNIFLGTILSIIDLVTGNFEGFKKDLENILSNLKDAFSKIWDGIKQIFSGALQAISGYITGIWETIKTITSTIWDSIKNIMSKIWEGIKDTAVKVFNSIVDIITSVFDFIKDLPKKMIEFGKNIIKGLIDGIKSMIGKVGEVISSVADKITGGIRGALGIHSPSKVMMEMGEYTGEGFIQGLKSTISEISRQSQAMSKAAQINVPKTNYSRSNAPGNINGATGDTYITMNVNMSQIEDLIKFNQMIKNAKQTARAT